MDKALLERQLIDEDDLDPAHLDDDQTEEQARQANLSRQNLGLTMAYKRHSHKTLDEKISNTEFNLNFSVNFDFKGLIDKIRDNSSILVKSLIDYGVKMEASKLKDETPSPPTTPPDDFSDEKVWDMLLSGFEPPSSWWPFIKIVNLIDTDFKDTELLKNLTALEILGLRYTQTTDLAPLVGLDSLKYLEVDKSVDISPLAHMVKKDLNIYKRKI